MESTNTNKIAFSLRGEFMDTLSYSDFEERVEKSDIPALLIFTAPGCKPCMLMASDLEELEASYAGHVAFFRIDTSQDMELAVKLAVVSTPTIILYVGGKPVTRIVGYKTSRDIRSAIDDQLKISAE